MEYSLDGKQKCVCVLRQNLCGTSLGTAEVGDNNYCTLNACNEGEGDCDSNNDCSGNLNCGTNNCVGSEYHGESDCCSKLSH